MRFPLRSDEERTWRVRRDIQRSLTQEFGDTDLVFGVWGGESGRCHFGQHREHGLFLLRRRKILVLHDLHFPFIDYDHLPMATAAHDSEISNCGMRVNNESEFTHVIN